MGGRGLCERDKSNAAKTAPVRRGNQRNCSDTVVTIQLANTKRKFKIMPIRTQIATSCVVMFKLPQPVADRDDDQTPLCPACRRVANLICGKGFFKTSLL